MNTDQTTAEQQRVIAQAAASYTPPEPQSHALLMPHRESIATLRRKGASYRTIAKILHTVDVQVSLDTLSRFYREAIEEKPARKTRRRPVVVPPLTSSQPAPGPEVPTDEQPNSSLEASTAPRGKGPRIADPTNI